MKKLLICMVMATMAVCANAQITWNVRAGAGFQHYESNDYYSGSKSEGALAPTLILESNIPLAKASPFTFSPSISTYYTISSEVFGASCFAHFGYKIPIASNTLFCPKIGPMVGYQSAESTFLFGPSIELPFEINRIVVAANANVSLVDDTLFYRTYPPMISLQEHHQGMQEIYHHPTQYRQFYNQVFLPALWIVIFQEIYSFRDFYTPILRSKNQNPINMNL